MIDEADKEDGHHFLMCGAWQDFLSFASGYEPMRKAFETDTGIRFRDVPKSPIDAMIDKAVGIDHEQTMLDFALWATLTQWGTLGVPEDFLAKARERFPVVAAEIAEANQEEPDV